MGEDYGRVARTQFRGRASTLFGKGKEIAEKCDAEVYIFIGHRLGETIYSSKDPSNNCFIGQKCIDWDLVRKLNAFPECTYTDQMATPSYSSSPTRKTRAMKIRLS